MKEKMSSRTHMVEYLLANEEQTTRKSTTALADILANTRCRVDETLQDDKHWFERLALQ